MRVCESMCQAHTRLVTCDRGPYFSSSSDFAGRSLSWKYGWTQRTTAAVRASPCWWHWGRGRIWNAGESWEPTWRLTTPARFPFQAGYTKLLPGCPLTLDESCPEPAASACPPMWVPLPALPAPSGHREMLVCFISGPHDSDNCLSYRWSTACPSHRPQSSVVLWPIQA